MNRAVKIRIYPDKEQSVQIEKTIGCSRFIYNQMLADKISYYQKEKKMLRNTPAGYKKEYPWLKEVDSLALANAQLHLESAFRKFFREPSCGFPRYKSRKHSRNSYTTNAVNGNILLQDTHLKLPKMSAIKIKLHRQIPSDWKLKSVTISREPSGKYFASLLFCCENQTVEKRAAESFLGIDFAMQGMCVFSTGERAEYPMFYRKAEKKLAREQRKLSHCEKGSRNYQKQKKKVALCHEKIKNQRKDFQHKLSRELAERYDAVCVEDLNLQGMSGGLHLGKGVQDNGYGQFLSMLGAALLIRNGVGTAGLLVLAILCLTPMVKLLAGGCLYRLLAAVAQPVADKRLTECVDGLGRGILLLLRIFLFTGILFFLSLALAFAR